MNNIFLRNLVLKIPKGKDENFANQLRWILLRFSLEDRLSLNLNPFLTKFKQNFSDLFVPKCNTNHFFFNSYYLNQKNFQSDFVLQLWNYINYLPNLANQRFRLKGLLFEISTLDSTIFQLSIKSNHTLRSVIFSIFLKIRLLNILCYILKNFSEKNIKFLQEFLKSGETKELITMFSDGQVLILNKIYPKIDYQKKNTILKNSIKIKEPYKFAKHLYLFQLKPTKMFGYQKLITIAVVNGILMKKLRCNKFGFYFYKEKIWNRFRVRSKLKNIVKFYKKEIFTCSIHIFSKNFKKNTQLKFLNEVTSLFLKIYENSSKSIYKFNILQKFSYFFEKFKNSCKKPELFEKNFNYSEKSLLLDFLIKFDSSQQREKEAMLSEKKAIKKALIYLTKGLILSNSFRKLLGLLWYLTSFSLLKKALENSWRMQLTNRTTIFFDLNLDKSMKFSSDIIRFYTKIQNKFRSHLLHELLNKLKKRFKIERKSLNLFIYVENLFQNSQMILKTKSKVHIRQLNRIIGIGNFFLLTILRIKKIFTNNFKTVSDVIQKRNNLFYIFEKKIEILSKNLNNSIKFLEASNFF